MVFLGRKLPYTPDFLAFDKVHGARYIELKPKRLILSLE